MNTLSGGTSQALGLQGQEHPSKIKLDIGYLQITAFSAVIRPKADCGNIYSLTTRTSWPYDYELVAYRSTNEIQ